MTKQRYKLTFLGCGSAFATENYQSNLLLEDRKTGKKLLLDCGSDLKFSLKEYGLKPTDLTDIYISHPHADHIGGLEFVAFCTKFVPNHPSPNLILSESMVEKLWDNSLKGGLESLEGESATLGTYFNVQPIVENGSFMWGDISFKLVQVVHVMNDRSFMPSYGLLFNANGTDVFWSSDTQFCPKQIMKFYDFADLILHDCETSPFASGVHPLYNEMKLLPEAVKKKMWLYHYSDGAKPDCKKDGFQGWITQQKSFFFSETRSLS